MGKVISLRQQKGQVSLFNDILNQATLRDERGWQICKESGCQRFDTKMGECYGWDDPLYWWEIYGDCPHYSGDPRLLRKIDDAMRKE